MELVEGAWVLAGLVHFLIPNSFLVLQYVRLGRRQQCGANADNYKQHQQRTVLDQL
jgi:hypothetical protein